MKVKQFIKKNRIVLCTLALIVMGMLLGAGILFFHGEMETSAPDTKLNEDRSLIYVTGKNYSLNDRQEQEFLEQEKKKENKVKETPEEESILEHLIQNTQLQETEKKEEAAEGKNENNEISEEPGNGSGGQDGPGDSGGGETGNEPGTPEEPGTGENGQGQEDQGDNQGGEDEETKRPLIETTLVNNMDFEGSMLSFEIWATDYLGRALSADKIYVTVNGEHTYSSGSNNHQNHIKVNYTNVPVNDGINEIVIKVTDKEKNTAEKKYIINADTSGPREEDGTISIRLGLETLGLGTLVRDDHFKLYKGENVAFVVDRFLKENGINYDHTGSLRTAFYLQRIYFPDITEGYRIPDKLLQKLEEENVSVQDHKQNSLGEKDFYDGAGMMYMLNGWIGDGMSTQTVRDGDELYIGFTLNLIKEYNGEWFYYGEW